MHLTKGVAEASDMLEDLCGICRRPGHRSTAKNPCTRPKVPWAKVGIEIEGFWRAAEFQETYDRASEVTGMDSTQDVSLNGHRQTLDNGTPNPAWDADDAAGTLIRSGNHYRYTPDAWASWEFRTSPKSANDALKQLLALYPHGTNCRASMHVHMSFTSPPDLALLKTPAFWAYFAKEWHTWGLAHAMDEPEFWPRLAGKNKYCLPPRHFTDREVRDGVGRYCQLNFQSAWNAHQTLECRLLPMFRDARNGVLAVQQLCQIYDKWITGAGEGAAAWETAQPIEASTVPLLTQDPLTYSANVYEGMAPRAEFSALEVLDTYPTVAPTANHRLMPERDARRGIVARR